MPPNDVGKGLPTYMFRECDMPIYEYVCQSCGHETEIMHKISDPPATDCPECSQPALSKLISAAGFRLSGGGWYETDFKSGGKRNLAGDKGAETKQTAETKKDSSGDSGKPAVGEKPAGGAARTEAAPAKPARTAKESSTPAAA